MSSSIAYKKVDLEQHLAFNEELERDSDNAVYVSKLVEPLRIVTSPVRLLTSLEDGPPFAQLGVDDSLYAFLESVEQKVLQECLARKTTWFRGEIPDETIVAHVKTFLAPEEKAIKVKVSDDLECFAKDKSPVDLPAEGVLARGILEASRITFGRTEFGLIWTLRQLRLVGECVIPESEECIAEPCTESESVPLEPLSILARDTEGLNDSIA